MQLYDTIEECLEAVNSGEVDYTYGTSYTTPYYLNIDELSNILYLPTSTQSIDICFGLAQPVDPDLLVILNKALRSLNSAQLDSIIYDNSLIDQDEQINLFIKDHLENSRWRAYRCWCSSSFCLRCTCAPACMRARRTRREFALSRAVPPGKRAVLRVFHKIGHPAHFEVEIASFQLLR